MQADFYDVKSRKKVKADVTEKVTYGEGVKTRYAIKGKTDDGRNLTTFVSKDKWESITV